jgi:hypothetical protein
MAEQTFLNERGITVTNARFIIGSQTHAMSAVTSVKTLRHTQSRSSAVVLGVISLIVTLAGKGTIVGGIGLVFFAVSVLWFMARRTKYAVVLNSASGEAEVLSSKDAAFIQRVGMAVNEAIVARG